jgi:uracil-DNA glycosylase
VPTEILPFANYSYPADGKPPLLALIGEAPGADEIKLGRPFVGRAGQLLDRVLQQVGIDRDRCLIANVFRYRPPDNNVGHFFSSRRRAVAEGEPLAEHWGKLGADFCKARYATEIEALGQALTEAAPPVIVALGRTPLWALTGRNGITAMRGRVLQNRLSPAPVIATFHPSFVMRQNSIGPETEATFAADLAMALKMAS